ncbi:hypothetical protein D9619_006941 [Psilocybe cf. subviscida]|uniref:NAD(P)-binding protein n=1 Tax=Psilocybe cf. subviscida TaxID=2480587 RepID=A0A8H5B1N1_9AGAR|nr:hypothetical protein D9619_006941 [Psilocybe cf. subviscida]
MVALLAKNAKVYVAARSEEKAREAIEELKTETNNEGIFLKLDLNDLSSVKSAAQEFLSGVMYPRREDLTAQGYDAQFGVNALALRTAAKSSPDGKSRVIHTSSFAGRFVDKIEYNTLTDTPARTKAFEYVLYSQSKLANSFISNEMARRYGDEGVISVSLHPGFLSSDLLRNLSLWQLAMVYLIPWARVGKCNPAAEDQAKLTELWDWLEAQVQKFEGK